MSQRGRRWSSRGFPAPPGLLRGGFADLRADVLGGCAGEVVAAAATASVLDCRRRFSRWACSAGPLLLRFECACDVGQLRLGGAHQLMLVGELFLQLIGARSLPGKFLAERDNLLSAGGELVLGLLLEFEDTPDSLRPSKQGGCRGVELAEQPVSLRVVCGL